ncbi:MAG TPA: hypothetical protein VLH16_04365, partial [Bacteroidales bacterium]|nr:hypothetical protein [Bacteroidales bacterium]
LTVITILLLTITHWVILLLQIPLFVKNPIWYWEIRFRPLSLWTLLYSIVTLAALCCAAWFMNARKRPWRSLIIIFIASIWLQFGIGYLEGGGVDALQERYFRTHHRAYAMLASKNNETIIANIINYEHTLATFLFTSTKPPGLMTFYIALERLVNGNPANTLMTEDTRLERLRNLITFVFPILAAGCIFLLYAFVRKYSLMTSDSESLIPSYLYILSPNIVLFSLFVDQAVYPSVFLGGAWLVFRLLNKYSPCSAFVLGIVLYVFAFFSFTILPLFPLAGIFLCLTWWQNRSRVVFFEKVISGLAFLSGVVSAYWLFRWIFNYDFLVRFAHTVEVNRRFDFYTRVGIEPILSPEPVGVRLQQILNALVWNNLDFAAAVGVAVYLLFAIHGLKLLFRIARREAASQEIMLASVFLSFLILNLGGTAQGEVARLWIFWVPAVVLFAGRELLHWKPDKRYPFYALLLAQFITIILTFHFQDLRM